MTLDLKETTAAAALLALAIFAWTDAGAFAAEARVFPRLVAGVMGALAFAMLARSFFANEEARQRTFFKSFPYFLLCLALIFGYVFSTSALGYFTASAIFIPAFALLLGLRRPVVIIASTVGFVVLAKLVFVQAFLRTDAVLGHALRARVGDAGVVEFGLRRGRLGLCRGQHGFGLSNLVGGQLFLEAEG